MKKQCTRCGEKKKSVEFQKRKASKDGLTASCKKCLSEYDKKRANLPHRVKARLDYSKTEKGIKSGNKAKKKWQDKNIVKRAAHILVGNAVRKGDLIKEPCEVCKKEKVNAHHNDYSKPLDVRWLCPVHHSQWHKENGEALNP